MNPVPKFTLVEHPILDSTNAELKRMGAPVWTAVAALRQTAGRGRLGRSFFSPPGGLYISFAVPLDRGPAITAKTAVAVVRAARRAFGTRLRIKWLNDILLGGRKVAGILAEVFSDRLVVGVGVNVSTPPSAFPKELQTTAGSLFPQNAPGSAIETLKQAIVVAFEEAVGQDCLAEYRALLDTLGEEVVVSGGGVELCRGRARDLTDDYHLLVEREDGTIQEIFAGEATLKPPRA